MAASLDTFIVMLSAMDGSMQAQACAALKPKSGFL
ncbi:hypothetical protein F753_05195 [Stutzerimonas chloritidismutans AW-1]|jgi:hypothetical protein|uniref:Uncharacterized protein n=2 Tax=Stutzerimonas stutzeri subgroup TaxID=578833 RepID=V4PW48_STUCH|nr:hypothetical protein F753_05195 [Stutzerimonas chloritidismutans AW-1]